MSMQLSRDALLEAYRKMRTIRAFEDKIHDLFEAGELPGFVHLYAGEEASAVGVCAHLDDEDRIVSTHRGHGHCIARGADPARMLAEFFGKETGYCRGRGGSMHIADLEGGNLGANGIVAGGLPIAVGVGMSIRAQRQQRVCMVFFGDGAANEGAFHESLNMAAIWKLPVVFVCENNKYAMSMDVALAMPVANVADRACAYAMPGVTVDGNDLPVVAAAAREAVDRAREGGGPTLVECKTYRWHGHSEHDKAFYRTDEELAMWKSRDPIPTFTTYLKGLQVLSDEKQAEIESRVRSTIDDAVEFAMNSPDPDPSDAVTDLYA